MREDIDVVDRRHRHHDLELARQIGLAIDRLHYLILAADDTFAVEPDLAIGRRARRQVRGDGARKVDCRGMRARLIRVGIAHDVAVDVAAGGDRIEKRGVDRTHGRLQVRLDDAVQLHRLPRGQPHRPVGIGARHLVDRQPLRRREHAAGNAHAQHKGEGFLHALLGALGAQVAVVLQVEAVEFDELLVVLHDRAGNILAQALLKRAAQIIARFLDALVARDGVGHHSLLSSSAKANDPVIPSLEVSRLVGVYWMLRLRRT